MTRLPHIAALLLRWWVLCAPPKKLGSGLRTVIRSRIFLFGDLTPLLPNA